MKKTKLQNMILEDNKKNYKFTLDKEKLFKDFDNELVKDNSNTSRKLKYNKSIVKYLITVSCCLVVAVFIGIYYHDQHKSPQTTTEFEEYVSEYVLNNEKTYYKNLSNDEKVNFYIYKYNTSSTKDGNIYYFYFLKNDNEEVYLINTKAEEEKLLQNNDFGILAIHSENEKDDIIEFCLKINGKTKKYEIN